MNIKKLFLTFTLSLGVLTAIGFGMNKNSIANESIAAKADDLSPITFTSVVARADSSNPAAGTVGISLNCYLPNTYGATAKKYYDVQNEIFEFETSTIVEGPVVKIGVYTANERLAIAIDDDAGKMTSGKYYRLRIPAGAVICETMKAAEDIDVVFTYGRNDTKYWFDTPIYRKTYLEGCTVTDTSIKDVKFQWNWFNIGLSTSDYPTLNPFETKSISAKVLQVFNVYDNIYFNNDASQRLVVPFNGAHIDIPGGGGHVSFGQAKDGLLAAGNVRFVNIPKGTVFPSYEFITSSGATKSCYRTTEDVTFGCQFTVKNTTVECKKVTFVDTDVDDFSVYAINNGWPAFHIAGNDFNEFTGTNFYQGSFPGSNPAGCNYFENVQFTIRNKTTHEYKYMTLAELEANGHAMIYHYGSDWKTDYIGFGLSGDALAITDGTSFRSAFIPKGTIFPSNSFLSNGGTTLYRTTKDVNFVLTGIDGNGQNRYKVYDEFKDEAKTISNFVGHFGKNGEGETAVPFLNMSINLEGLDAGKGTNAAFQGALGDSFQEHVKFYGADGNQVQVAFSDFNRYAFFADYGEYNYLFQILNITAAQVSKVVFEAGLQFPSLATVNGTDTTIYELENDSVWYYNPATKQFQDKEVFTVKFDSDGGTTVADAYVTNGDKVAQPQNVTKDSTESKVYTLEGWYNGSTKWDFSTDTVTSNITLKAKWTESTREYDVTFGTADPVKVPYGSTLKNYAPEDPVVKGHQFVGWYNGETKWDIDNDVVKGDLTLTAKFEHIFDKQVEDDKYLAEPGSCEVGAWYYYSCECGECGTQTWQAAAKGHSYVFVDTKEPEGEEPGVFQHYECEDCDDLFVKEDETYIKVTLEQLQQAYLCYDFIVKVANIGTVEYTDACKAKIDAARAAYDKIPAELKETIDPAYVKVLTDAEAKYLELKAAKELADAKKYGCDLADVYYEALDLNDYTAENQTVLANLLAKVKQDINAVTDKNQIEPLLNKFYDDVNAVETKAEAELKQAKADGLVAVQAYYDALDMSKYTTENQTVLANLLAKAKDDISKQDSVSGVQNAIAEYKAAVDKVEQIAPAKKGCGGSILAASAIVSLISVCGVALLSLKKKND